MANNRGLGRLAIVAVGLGIGAAVAHSPVAWADDLDFQISFDGYDLFPTTDNSATATTVTGEYGLAIAYGDGANASAEGGTGDYALAAGSDASAEAGALSGSGNNFDSAVDIGNNTGGYDGATATLGSYDSAIQIGNISGGASGPEAENGNYDTVISDGNITQVDWNSFAGAGNNNFAEAVGTNSYAGAGFAGAAIPGNNDVALVFDPSGTQGSVAEAGLDDAAAGDNVLAAVLGVDGANAIVGGSNYLYDIVTALGNESGTAAATSGGWLGELLSLF
jgi:hypothetical protein